MVHFAENAELQSIYLAQRLKLKQLDNRQGDDKENEYLLLKMMPSSNFLSLALDPDVCRDFPSQRPDVGAQGHHGGNVMGNGNHCHDPCCWYSFYI